MVTRNGKPSVREWKRYVPEGFGLSFELPGEPFERTFHVRPAIQSKVRESKVLDYLDEGLAVNIGHFVFKEQIDLGWFADEAKIALDPKNNSENLQCKKPSFIPKGDRLLFNASCSKLGKPADVWGLVMVSGQQAWLIDVQILREKQDGGIIRSRIFESVTVTK